ncbi:suppressor protein SRP40-like [Colias croceus]|uniref:suppressor protein SRP40-like n=1 Tax=Colias crocea TaxID=72248 RepID=UPI001E27F091|nr:suppressor protein SRP40-like [Colias croceus]
MDVNNIISEIKDGDPPRSLVLIEAPSIISITKPKSDGNAKKKRRRGKTKRQIMKPYLKISWQERRKNEVRSNSKRNKRYRKIVLAKTQAPCNNNQFLMEIHKPEPENSFNIFRTPSARTRDSSFSVDSEENYFFSLPEDEEEYLTKEFSSVYEDAQCERLSNMSKNELIEEYLILEAKYDTLLKRTERYNGRDNEEEKTAAIPDKEVPPEKSNDLLEKDASVGSLLPGPTEEQSMSDILQRLKQQEERINELEQANEKLKAENEHYQHQAQNTSEDSESDSSSSSDSCSSSSCSSPEHDVDDTINGTEPAVHMNGDDDSDNVHCEQPLVNGFHKPTE